jgi:hypothetical protein
METPRKPLNKYWCSVPHYMSDIRNIYIKADRDHAQSRKRDLPYVINSLNILLYVVF